MIVAPLVFPIAIELGIDPIHLGIIMVVNMEIGMITPPVGLNLFVTSGVAGMPMMRVVKAALPFLAVLFVFLIMVTYIPAISDVACRPDDGAGDHNQVALFCAFSSERPVPSWAGLFVCETLSRALGYLQRKEVRTRSKL